MNWYYVDAGQQAGPVDDAQLEELARTGKIQPDTLVWREGLANWQPYSQAKAPAAPPVSPVAPPPVAGTASPGTTHEAVCSQCGRIFGISDMIRHKGNYICANCKPVFMQKLSEGMAGNWAAGGTDTARLDEVLARDYEHDMGGYFSRAWETFKANAGIIIGVSLLVYICMMAAQMVPYLGAILGIIFTGPLMGGLWNFYLKKIRGLEAGISDGFSGFGPRFGQLLLANFIPGLLAGLCMMPLAILAILGVFLFAGSRNSGSPMDSTTGIILLVVGGLFMLAGACAAIYFSVCWMFTLPLVADKGMSFWPAMSVSRKVVGKHWWMTFLIMIVVGLVGFCGVLACGVGMLVSGPVAFATIACMYDKLFGDLAPES